MHVEPSEPEGRLQPREQGAVTPETAELIVRLETAVQQAERTSIQIWRLADEWLIAMRWATVAASKLKRTLLKLDRGDGDLTGEVQATLEMRAENAQAGMSEKHGEAKKIDKALKKTENELNHQVQATKAICKEAESHIPKETDGESRDALAWWKRNTEARLDHVLARHDDAVNEPSMEAYRKELAALTEMNDTLRKRASNGEDGDHECTRRA